VNIMYYGESKLSFKLEGLLMQYIRSATRPVRYL
jgi:hypothetical protein